MNVRDFYSSGLRFIFVCICGYGRSLVNLYRKPGHLVSTFLPAVITDGAAAYRTDGSVEVPGRLSIYAIAFPRCYCMPVADLYVYT